MGSSVCPTSLVLFTFPTQISSQDYLNWFNANIIFQLERKQNLLSLCIIQILLFVECINTENEENEALLFLEEH